MTKRKRHDHNPRAQAFSSKFRAWLAANKRAYEEGRDRGEPRNPSQMANLLTRLKEECGRSTAQGWYDGVSLPESRFVASIERLMLAPWCYLDDPSTEWPPPVEVVAAFTSILTDARARSRISAAIVRPGGSDRGSPAR